MRLTVQSSKRALPKTDLLVVLAWEGADLDLPAGVVIPSLATSAFQGEFRETRLTDAVSGPGARVLRVGLGKAAEVDAERLRRAAAIAVKKAERVRAAKATILAPHGVLDLIGDHARAGQALAEGAVLGSYACTEFKSDRKEAEPKLKAVALTTDATDRAFEAGAKRGEAIGRANAFTRDLQNTPGNLMRPRDLVAAAKGLAKRSARITCSALDEAQMKKLGMGSLLSVSRGSEEPAYLIHLVHRPRGRSRGRLAFVGKGLTFDAGGISLKRPQKMDEMRYDMSGGAAVLGIFHALADLDLPFEVHGLVPTSENLPDGKATKPGDIVTAMNGKTIEVLNTDAEGRLILADALAYAAKNVKPDAMVDMATLTGAVVVALGHELSGCITQDEALGEALVAAGRSSGELVWRLPLLDVHKGHMKGTFADLRNINSGQGAGSTAGGAFLSNFVGDVPWAHLDIAGTAWGVEDRDYQNGSSGTGVGVRLLVQFLDDRAASVGAAPPAQRTAARRKKTAKKTAKTTRSTGKARKRSR